MLAEAISGASLRGEREEAEIGQEAVARAMDVSVKTVQRLEKAETVKRRDAAAYRGALRAVLERDASIRPDNVATTGEDAWSPNPALKGIIPPRAYEAAIDYCRRLVRAGLPRDEVENLERVMIDSRYAKANSRRGRELSEEDWMLLVDDAWDAIREALSGRGVRV